MFKAYSQRKFCKNLSDFCKIHEPIDEKISSSSLLQSYIMCVDRLTIGFLSLRGLPFRHLHNPFVPAQVFDMQQTSKD